MYKFIHHDEKAGQHVEITMLEDHLTWPEILATFMTFLKACTFHFREGDYFDVCNDEIQDPVRDI